MMILRLIAAFILEVVLIDTIGGALSRINKKILKLRGIEKKAADKKKV